MKRWSLFLIVVLLLSLVPAVSMGFVGAVATHTVSVEPTDDTYVKDTSPDSSYGYSYVFYVGTYYKDGANERAYLKFNLSGFPSKAEIISVKLYAYTYRGAHSTPVNISVYSVEDDSWTETTITWNNKPPAVSFLDKYLTGLNGGWSVWDVTNFVIQELQGDKIASFVLISDEEGVLTESIGYTSKESKYKDEHPYLEIIYKPPIHISGLDVSKSATRGRSTPIITTLVNEGTTDENVTFLLYIDGSIMLNQTIKLMAGEEKSITYNWTPQTIGTHQIKAEISGYDTKYASVDVYENPSTIVSTFSRYYSIRYIRQEPRVNELYEKFTNLTEQLEKYGVDLSPLKGDIEKIATLKKEMEDYHAQVLELSPYVPSYLTTKYFILTRKAGIAQNKLLEELNTIIPVLEEGLQNAKAGENVTLVSPTPVKVLIDNSHNQYYNSKQMLKLATNIKNELGWEVKGNDEPLTLDLLREYDVVILPNPGKDITDEEAQALKEYVEEGGALLILGDWYKYVNAESLNKVVGEFGITFNEDELMDEEKNTGASYFPLVGEFSTHPAMKFLAEGNELYYNGDTLELSGNATWLIRGYETSYSVDGSGNTVKEKGSKPVVAAAVEVGKGRIVAYGSSKALSDAYDGHYIDSNWPFVKGVLLWLIGQI